MVEPIHILAALGQVCDKAGSCGLPTPTPNHATIQNILKIVWGIVGALALLMITISGLRYITSAGSPEGAAKAREGIIHALVGLIIAIIAVSIINFVVNWL